MLVVGGLMSRKQHPPLIVITGPTASGKTGLAITLAERWSGEIVCADSRTVYKDMDIGTAKPTRDEQQRVPHWLLDVARPGERFTVSDFQRHALHAIADIRAREKVPFLVGGTGLYIDSVILDYTFGPEADWAQREQLEQLSVQQLQEMLKKHHIPLPENNKNKRHLIRSYEKNNISTSRKNYPADDTYVVAIPTPLPVLEERIRHRAKTMFNDKIVQETQHILDTYGAHNEALTGNVYPLVQKMLNGELSREQAEEQSVLRDRQLAKRQLTWLRRHDWVQWRSLQEAEQYFDNILSQYRDA